MAAYHVTYLHSKPFPLLKDKLFISYIEKWSLLPGLHVSAWAFNESYSPLKVKDLITVLLKEALLTDQPLPKLNLPTIQVEPVPCFITSLEFFDRLLDPKSGVVSLSGDNRIRGCFEEFFGDLAVNDELRQMLLNVESKNYSLYNSSERKEFLFRLFYHLALGGRWCQYEDFVTPYIKMATSLYKNLLNVQRNAETKGVEIRSKCFRVCGDETNEQEFVYVLVDPGLREATIFGHCLA